MASDLQPAGKSIFGAMKRAAQQNARQSERMAGEDYQAYLLDLDEAGYELDPESGKPRKKASAKRTPALASND